MLPLSAAEKPAWLYIGTYTGPQSKGIQSYRFTPSTGALSDESVAAEIPNPTFLAISPNQKFLYAVSEVGQYEGQRSGSVSAYAIDRKTGKLTFLNRVPSRGAGPCFVTVDKLNRNVLVANYGGGSVAVLPVEADGRLREASSFVQHSGSGPNPQRQKEPHAHSINLSPDNRFALVADLGTDEVVVYRFDPAAGTLTRQDTAKLKPGAGPRHLTFSRDGNTVYVINELQSTITRFAYEKGTGKLTEKQTISTLPADFQGSSTTAEVQVHPSGKFVYGSNRGHDSIAVFAVAPGSGELSLVQNASTQGKTPRNFRFDLTGHYLFAGNQDSNTFVTFKVDPATGRLTPTGTPQTLGAPVCFKFVPVQ